MGWLDDLNKSRTFVYKSEDGETIQCDHDFLVAQSGDENFDPCPNTEFEYEGKVYSYAGFEPTQLSIMTKIQFEKNGRKGMLTRFADGGQTTRSMTRERYYQGKGTDSVLTKGCREVSDKVLKNIEHTKMSFMNRVMKQEIHTAKEAKRGRKR